MKMKKLPSAHSCGDARLEPGQERATHPPPRPGRLSDAAPRHRQTLQDTGIFHKISPPLGLVYRDIICIFGRSFRAANALNFDDRSAADKLHIGALVAEFEMLRYREEIGSKLITFNQNEVILE